jgi:hypothetical protein
VAPAAHETAAGKLATSHDASQRGFFLRYFSHYEELLDEMKRFDIVKVGEEMKVEKR